MDAPSLVLNNNQQAVWGGKGADACAVQGFRQLSPFLLWRGGGGEGEGRGGEGRGRGGGGEEREGRGERRRGKVGMSLASRLQACLSTHSDEDWWQVGAEVEVHSDFTKEDG